MSQRWRLLYCLGVVWAGGGLTGCRGPALVGGVGSGEKIYAASCAECHGQTGQGVAGKYAEALGGDWALPRLTQYIAKSMPDDHPGTLTVVAAQAVAAYVYEAFYSRAAQLRRHPARIEIAHLTNRQYLVTVADLLRQFAPLETPPEIARGLRVT